MSESRSDAVTTVLEFAAANELEAHRGERPDEVVVELPGEKKLKTVTSLLAGERDLSVSAFVIRNPDENHEEVYRYLLSRNLRMRAGNLGYAIDASGDVYVVGSLPLTAVDAHALDLLFGAILEASDTPFNELLALGFLTSMKREWAWRTSGASRCATWRPSGICSKAANSTPTPDNGPMVPATRTPGQACPTRVGP